MFYRTPLFLLALAVASGGCSGSESQPAADVGNPQDAAGADAGTGHADAGGGDLGAAGSDADAAAGDGAGAQADGGAATLIAPCDPATPATCAYAPPVLYEPNGGRSEQEIRYQDITGAERAFRIELRRPVDLPTPSPLIVWSHGGSGGKEQPSTVGVEWGEVFARAGYLSIAIAHPGRGPAEMQALCEALELGDCALQTCTSDAECLWGTGPDAEPGACTPDAGLGTGYCRFFKPGNWDRPHDVRAVLNWVEAEASGGMLDGVVDVSKIAYAGHSAGAGSTMMVAGATRRYREGAQDWSLIDPRPVAFLSCSPQGPGDDGFTEASFTREQCVALADSADHAACLSRPHLVLTGVDDGGVGETRRLSFDLAPDGDRYLGYITEPAAQHTTFDYATEGCSNYAAKEGLGPEYPERCNTYRLWLRSAAVAFFDAKLRGDAAAQAYLDSDNLAAFGGAAFEWMRK